MNRSAKRRPGSQGYILRSYLAANFLILLLPTALAFVYYQVSATAIRKSMDELARNQLDAGLAALDLEFAGLRRNAARFASDYEINLYLNKAGPLSGIEAYNLKRISDKIAPLVHGSGLVSDFYIYFARSGMIAYESGFSPYADFYGPLLQIQGRGADQWRRQMLAAAEGESILQGLELSFGGRAFVATAAVWPLGYGDYIRGAAVAVIDEAGLVRPLARLAAEYRGWVAIMDGRGRAISVAGEGSVPDGLFEAGLHADGSPGSLRLGKADYRVYRSAESVAGWTYLAVLDESVVLAGARTVRDSALLLLALALAIGSLASFGIASTLARPLRKLLSLALGTADPGPMTTGSVYQRAEEAILALSDSRERLKAEAVDSEELARGYFLRRLLEGAYRERELFEAEAARFGLDLSGAERFVLLCRMTSPEGGHCPSPAPPPRRGGFGQGVYGLGAGEYRVFLSLEETAWILKASEGRRSAAAGIAESVRAAAPAEIRSSLAFAAGAPAADPLLLQASCLQARAALDRLAQGAMDAVFYEDLPQSPGGPRFAIDLEESIMKAVRSANGLLLASLVDALLRANFDERALSPAEARDLAVSLRMAAIRLLPEFPQEAEALKARLYAAPEPEGARASIEGTAAVLGEMAAMAGKRKRSRNRELARLVRAFIERDFASGELGLTVVAAAHRLSENYLSNLYKEQEGECISETIEKVRIAEARKLLAGGSQSVDEIAAACGYTSGVSFRRAFKRVEGVSPSDFRKSKP